AAQTGEHLDAIHPGQRDVEQYELGARVREAGHGLGPRLELDDVEALVEQRPQQQPVVRVVFDDGNGFHDAAWPVGRAATSCGCTIANSRSSASSRAASAP